MCVYSLASDDGGSSKLCQVLMHPLSHLHFTEKTGLIALSLQMKVQRLQELPPVISAGDRAEP